MTKESNNKEFIGFSIRVLIGLTLIVGFIMGTNCLIDGSSVISGGKLYSNMAQLALSGHIVATPKNYDGRKYQVAVIDELTKEPDTIVIGSSRGMFIGSEIMSDQNLYNHCVSGGIIADYYAILGLYEKRFSALPHRVIIETSPWCFYGDVPEGRWMENKAYREACQGFYESINGTVMEMANEDQENPYLSLAYFQYNLNALKENGITVLIKEKARVSVDELEAADYPDGTIRYDVSLEKSTPDRLKVVQSDKGALTYHNVDKMMGLDTRLRQDYENLLHYLLDHGIQVIIYLAPFSVTQCQYSFDDNLNPAINEVESYLREFSIENNIAIVGSYDARNLGLSDEVFIDRMHMDRKGNEMVWQLNGGLEE